jgi:hypothetical protein
VQPPPAVRRAVQDEKLSRRGAEGRAGIRSIPGQGASQGAGAGVVPAATPGAAGQSGGRGACGIVWRWCPCAGSPARRQAGVAAEQSRAVAHGEAGQAWGRRESRRPAGARRVSGALMSAGQEAVSAPQEGEWAGHEVAPRPAQRRSPQVVLGVGRGGYGGRWRVWAAWVVPRALSGPPRHRRWCPTPLQRKAPYSSRTAETQGRTAEEQAGAATCSGAEDPYGEACHSSRQLCVECEWQTE